MKSLAKNKYENVKTLLQQVTINNLFARSVIEQHANGVVSVDNEEDPRTAYIVHSYGMSLLFGETDNDEFNSRLADYLVNKNEMRKQEEWMQVFPNDWSRKLSDLLGANLLKPNEPPSQNHRKKIESYTRVNFSFNQDRYLDFKIRKIKKEYEFVPVDNEIFATFKGSVIPRHFWRNYSDFSNNSIGFALKDQQQVVSIAFASFLHGDQLELGMETLVDFRGKGFAQHTCARLVDYCLENNFEPIWACRLENEGSFKLAQKIGFEPTLYLPYFRLRV